MDSKKFNKLLKLIEKNGKEYAQDLQPAYNEALNSAVSDAIGQNRVSYGEILELECSFLKGFTNNL